MEKQINIITNCKDYNKCKNSHYKNWHQIHIYTVFEIISTYYNPEFIGIEEVRAIAKKNKSHIKQFSEYNLNISLFEKNGKFLISEDTEFLTTADLWGFDHEKKCYVDKEVTDDFFSFIGEAKADEFIKNSLISVGAEEVYSEIETYAINIRKNQDRITADFIKWRELNKTNPLLKLELYRIEQNYIPRLIEEYSGHSYNSILFLPENKYLLKLDERTTFLLREIATNKIIEGNLNDAIEHAKYEKWLRKHPPLMDPYDMMRMELDNDDPDLLSWDEYIANDDEFEEGDDEYSPEF